MLTRRQSIKNLLEETSYPLSAKDICDALDIKNRALVYEDLDHIAKSVKSEGKELLIRPASCGKCNYVFKVKATAKSPTKCPKCRSEWILPHAYLIREHK
jgi:predicted Zn-ribbon and HTH transcriptional regulator